MEAPVTPAAPPLLPPDAIRQMDEMARWLSDAVRTGLVSAISIVVVDTSSGMPTPHHVFFSAPGAAAPLAGGYLMASADLVRSLTAPPPAAAQFPPAPADTPPDEAPTSTQKH